MSRATERDGVNHVSRVVEGHNSIFHEIDQRNDMGLDGYIEFLTGEDATGCCIGVQIKSGASYVRREKQEFVLQADRDHFRYWQSHSLPIAAILYDPEQGKGAWCDITAHLAAHPERVAQGPYSIHVPFAQEFERATFADFRAYCLAYQTTYSDLTRFGRALANFASIESPKICLDGLRALFSFHRQKAASWYYLVNSFRNFRGHPFRYEMARILSFLPGHGDIFWGDYNHIDQKVRDYGLSVIARDYGPAEVRLLLECIDEDGIDRGTIGQCVDAVIDVVPDKVRILRELAFDPTLSEDARVGGMLLLIHYQKDVPVKRRIKLIEKYLRSFPMDGSATSLEELIRILVEFGEFWLY